MARHLIQDTLVIVGTAAGVFGLYAAWPPLGWIAGGAIAIAAGVWLAARGRR